MAFDLYSLCPGGTGKKIKFCCTDLLGDLEQLDRLIEGDQISAALQQVELLSQRFPNRACLMATRTKLELASKKFSEASATSRQFLEAFPTNALALGHAAVTEAIAGRIQESAAMFDKAREAAGADASPELVRIAATLVQAGAQAGHVGFAQSIVEWMLDRSLGTAEDRRLLAAVVGSSGVPAALRTKMRLHQAPVGVAWHAAFEGALKEATDWKLAQALSTFRSLKSVAGNNRALFTNIAILCEMLARPFEAAEAWLTVASLAASLDESLAESLDESNAGTSAQDEASELTGRAIALENEANPDRSPQVYFERSLATLAISALEPTAIELLEDKLRHSAACEVAAFERSEWVARGAAPPRSVWRVFEQSIQPEHPARLLASLLIFGRQTDREPEAVLQGFAPDVATARTIVGPLLGAVFVVNNAHEGLPTATPTNWLLAAQYRIAPPPFQTEAQAAPNPTAFEELLKQQSDMLWQRFLLVWPETPLPELLGQTPREALKKPEGARRVEALLTEGEATSRRSDAADAWSAMREKLGVALPATLESAKPLEELPPMRWHRVAMQSLDLDQLRGLFFTSVDAGFDLAAERAAETISTRSDASPEDRWEALSLLEDRAFSSVRKLEIISELRSISQTLKASDGMIDVAELRIHLQRGDQVGIMRLLDHLRREHSRDKKVLEALAEVLGEAGIDLSAFAGQAAMGSAANFPGASVSSPGTAQPEGNTIWTPGSQPGGSSTGSPTEKKAIWTPG